MWFAFAIQVVSVLLMFQPDKSLSCDQADWSVSLDRATWSRCPNTNTYLTGLWRNDRHPGDERVGRIEYGRCCKATESSYVNQPATCSNANWLYTLDGWVIRKIEDHWWKRARQHCRIETSTTRMKNVQKRADHSITFFLLVNELLELFQAALFPVSLSRKL